MNPASAGRVTRARVAWVAIAATVGCLAFSAYASASSISVVATPNPARAAGSVTLTNTGLTNPATPDASYLIYDYYAPGAAGCAPTAADARARTSGDGYINTIELNPAPSFSQEAVFTPTGGAVTYRICAYLYTGGGDSAVPEAVGTTLLSVPLTRAQLLARAIKKCHKTRSKTRRAKCVAAAHRRYHPKK
jgi:hypothetical protein